VVIETTTYTLQLPPFSTTTTTIESIVATLTQAETSTVVPQPPATCTSFKVGVSGSAPGQYLNVHGDTVGFTNDVAAAAGFAIDSQGRLSERSSGLYLNINSAPLFTVYLNSESEVRGFGYVFFTCSATPGDLQCTAGSGTNFYYCPTAGNGNLVFGTPAGAQSYNCGTPLSLSKLDCV
jgi:hypothetical protein